MDSESINAYLREETFPAKLVAVLEEKPFMIYRSRNPNTGKLANYFTVVNEDEHPRRGYAAGTLMAAFEAAFPEPNAHAQAPLPKANHE